MPNDQTVLRHVGAGRISDGRVDGSAFRLKPGEVGLSVSWPEASGESFVEGHLAVCICARRQFGKNDKFAALRLADVVAAVEAEWPGLHCLHAPLPADEQFPDDPYHAEIMGLPANGLNMSAILGDMIADCVSGLMPVR